MLLGSHNEILLSDFGIAVIAHGEHSLSTKEALGTVPYMAPEQIRGKPRPASDQYALGIVVYEWLCGERPFQGPEVSIIDQHLSRPPTPIRQKNAAIPIAVEEVIQKALAKDPQERFPNIQDFAQALEEAGKQPEKQAITTLTTRPLDETQPSDPPIHTRGPRLRVKKNWAIALVALLFISMATYGGILAFAHSNSSGDNPLSNVFKGQAPATVTITPDSKTVQDAYTITGANATNQQQRQVAVRTVLGSAQEPTKNVKATGHNAHPATEATGTLTFFNNAAVAQQVSGGTSFSVGGGVQIITNAAVNIPAGNGFTDGTGVVGAHATPAGHAGDIGALTLDVTSCCATGISVSNTTAFTGGQDAVNYTFLQQSDVNNAISQAMKDDAKQNALANLQKQVRPGEQPLGSTQCTPTTSVDQPVGDKGSNVTSANATYLVKCTATVYDYQSAQTIIQNLLKEKAQNDPGPNYALVGMIQTSVTGQARTGNVLSFFFSAKGIWIYQFTNALKLKLAQSIAGKSIAHTQNILNSTTGVGSAKIDYTDGNTLPTDANQISIVIKPISGLPGSGPPTAIVGSPTTTTPNVQSGMLSSK